MHRDLMSAYLSRFVNQNDQLSLLDARNGYRGAEPFLLEAWQEFLNREQVSDAESGLIALERFSDKLRKVDQIAVSSDFGRKVNPNSQPESASRSVRGVAQQDTIRSGKSC
jgi:putative transposase